MPGTARPDRRRQDKAPLWHHTGPGLCRARTAQRRRGRSPYCGGSCNGGRGIVVCSKWYDKLTYIGWIEQNLGPRPDSMSLDRIDNNGDYEPGNMQWAMPKEQSENRQRSSMVLWRKLWEMTQRAA